MYRSATSDGPSDGDSRVTPLYPQYPPVSPAPGAAAASGWMQREWDMAAVVHLLWRQRLLIAATVAGGLILAVLLIAQWPRAYTAASVVLLDPGSQPTVQFEELLTGQAPDDQTLSSEILVLRAPALAANVVRQLRLTGHPDFNPDLPQHLPPFAVISALPRRWIEGAGQWLGLQAPPPPIPPEAHLEKEAVQILGAFAKRLEVERMGRSHAIRVAVTSHDPGLAADTANAVVDRYLADQLQAKHAATEFAGSWLDKRVDDLRQKVEVAEQAVEEYRVRSGLIDSNGVTVTTQQLAELNSQLIAARGETAAARARLTQVQRQVQVRGDALSAAEVLSSPLIHRLKEQEVEVLRQRADLGQEYGPRHPRMLSVEAELSDIQSKIAAEVRQIVAGLSNEVAVANAQEGSLAGALRRTEAAAADQSRAQVRLRALEREAEASRNLLQTFLQRYKQTSDQDSIQRPDARILVRAAPPERPSAPRRTLIVGTALAVSLLLGIGLAVLLGLRERGISAPAVLRQRLGVPVLGLVPSIKVGRRGHPADEIVQTPLGSFAEAVRMVAGGLGSAQTVLVTAAAAQEGKTSLSLALARVLAIQGSRVLVVDADMRRSALSTHFNLDQVTGLADLLAAPQLWPVPLASDRVLGLSILPAGSRRARAAGLGVGDGALEGLLQQWRQRYDHIVLDGAPSLLISDVRSMARLADGVVLAVRWRHTPLAAVEEAATQLREAGAVLLGTAMTQVDLKRLDEDGLSYGDAGAYSAGLGQYYREQGRQALAK